MNYERFKKAIVSLALMCVLAVSLLTTGASSVFAQDRRWRDYNRRDYDRWERRYDRDDWRRGRRVYRDPWARYYYWNWYPYRYRYPTVQYYSPYYYPYYNPYYYPHGHYGRIGKLHWWWR